MAGLKVKIGADASQFERTMRGVRKDVGGVKKAILGIGAATGAIYAANKAFDAMRFAARGAFEFIKESSREAATLESLGVQFETLLGGASAAKQRIEEIVKFAASTPFQIEGLAEASAMLQGMTGGALATGDGLRLVGDAAAAVNKPLEVVGMNIGKIFQGLTQGGEVAEATNQLMQYGLVTGKAKVALQDFVKEAKAGDRAFLSEAKALEVLQQMFGQTEGAMARLAETTNGKISIMKDAIDQLQAKFGKGFNEGLKSALDATNEFLPQLSERFTQAGNKLGTSIKEAVEGDTEKLKAIGSYMGMMIVGAMDATFQEGKRALLRGFEDINPIRKLSDKLGLGGTAFGKRGSESMESGSNIIQSWQRSASNQLNAAFGGPGSMQTKTIGNTKYMVQSPNAANPSPYYDPKTLERLVIIGEKINNKLTPDFSTN